jgi:ribonuclease P protein component
LAGLDIILLVRGRIENPNPDQVTLDITRLFDKLLAKCRQA